MEEKQKLRNPSDANTPFANNDLSLVDKFYWRGVYENYAYPEDLIQYSIDLWNEDSLYGKVDDNEDAVYLDQSLLRQAPNTNKTVFLLNFVLTGYYKMTARLNKDFEQNPLAFQGSIYLPFNIQSAFQSPDLIFSEWMNSNFQNFVSVFLSTDDKQKMRNADDFIKYFVKYVEAIGSTYYFTMESLYLSNNTPYAASGLSFELSDNQSYSYDLPKKEEWINDPAFRYINGLANNFGFKVDRNAPWRFIADLNSKAMIENMAEFGYNREDIYDIAFIDSCSVDYDEFKTMIWKWYYQFFTLNPVISYSEKCGERIATKRVERIALSQEEFLGAHDESYWLRLYVYIRSIEVGKNWTQSEFDSVVKKAVEYYKLWGTERAVRFLASRISSKRQAEKLRMKKSLTEEEKHVILARESNSIKQFSF
jgi:hypothetical protein